MLTGTTQNSDTPHKTDHGSVRMIVNKERAEVGPGQFKIDPNLTKSGTLDSIMKQVIYASNIYKSKITEIVAFY